MMIKEGQQLAFSTSVGRVCVVVTDGQVETMKPHGFRIEYHEQQAAVPATDEDAINLRKKYDFTAIGIEEIDGRLWAFVYLADPYYGCPEYPCEAVQ